MKSIDLKETVELVGIVAILLGLYYVHQEVRLNSTIARAELSAETARNFSALDELLLQPEMTEVYVKSQEDPESLTATERMQVNTILKNVLFQYQREYYYYELGIFEEWESYPRYTALEYFGSRYGRAFWNTYRSRMTIAEISVVIDEVLSEAPTNDLFTQFDNGVLDQLKEN